MEVKKKAQLTGHNGAVYSLTSRGDTRHFFSAGGDGWLVKWDLLNPETGVLLAKIDTQVYHLNYDVKQQLLIAGDMNGGIHWIDIHGEEGSIDLEAHGKGLFCSLILEEMVLTGGGDGRILLWDRNKKRTRESLKLSNSSIRSIAIHPNGQLIAVGTSDNDIYFLTTEFKIVHKLSRAHDNSVFSVAFGTSNSALYSGGRDAHLKEWHLEEDFRCMESLPAHLYTLNTIAVHPGNAILATASRDRTVKLWQESPLKLVKVLDREKYNGHINSVNCLLWVDEKHLVSGSDDHSMIVWELVEVF